MSKRRMSGAKRQIKPDDDDKLDRCDLMEIASKRHRGRTDEAIDESLREGTIDPVLDDVSMVSVIEAIDRGITRTREAEICAVVAPRVEVTYQNILGATNSKVVRNVSDFTSEISSLLLRVPETMTEFQWMTSLVKLEYLSNALPRSEEETPLAFRWRDHPMLTKRQQNTFSKNETVITREAIYSKMCSHMRHLFGGDIPENVFVATFIFVAAERNSMQRMPVYRLVHVITAPASFN